MFQKFMDWWYGATMKAAPAPERPDDEVAVEKALAEFTPEHRSTFNQVLLVARTSGNWDKFSVTLFDLIERLSPDHQVVVLHALVGHDVGIVSTLAFARWARNNAGRLQELNIQELHAKVAAA